jgi:5-methylcytosine-specific restriction endonuclease McrA
MPAAAAEFKRMTGYPQGRPGYEVDHIVPLSRGGADKPSNMQWLTIQ